MAQRNKSPVTASVSKAKINESTGIILTDSASDGKIRISRIKYGSLFWSTRLKNGYQILSINGLSCEGNMTAELAARIIRNSKDVTVVAVDDGTTAVNPNTIRNHRSNDGASNIPDIYRSYEDVPTPIIKAKVLSPDGSVLPCPSPYVDLSSIAIAQVNKSPVTASVSKAKLSESTGLILTDSASDGKIRISRIKYGSLFWSTRLKNGYQLLSINGLSCGGNMTAELAARMIRNSKDVTVVAVDDGTTAVNPNSTSINSDMYPSYVDVPPPVVEAKMLSSDDLLPPSHLSYKEPEAYSTGGGD